MTTCYFVHHTSIFGNEVDVLHEIENINPDIIIGLCMEEYDYQYIFGKFITILQPYLQKTNKQFKLIAPYVDRTYSPPNVIVEDSYGYYDYARGLVSKCVRDNINFSIMHYDKLFTNYNNNNKYQRGMLIDEFARNDLLNYGIITLRKPNMRLPNGNDYKFKYYDGSIMVDEPDFELNTEPSYSAGRLPQNYLRGLVDIVSESTYESGQYFITEKTAKPLATLKPFLIFGPPLIHKHLHDKYQVDYYTEFFDYSFDNEENIEKRIDGIVKNLQKLKHLSKSELQSIYESTLPKLINNRKQYLNVGIKIPNTLKFLKGNNGVKLYGDTRSKILSYLNISI